MAAGSSGNGEDDDDDDGDTDDDGDDDLAVARQREVTDDYFHLKRSSAKTSDHTLAQLGGSRMTMHELRQLMKAQGDPFESELEALHSSILGRKQREWLAQLSQGFNVLCYGFGSKKALLTDFVLQHLNNSPHIVVNGYFPSLHVRQLLSCITESLLGYAGAFRSLVDQVAFIREKLEAHDNSPASHLYVVIHNIDGPMLRGEQGQMALSLLAEVPRVHIVATLDQINAPLMWDHDKLARFNWLWHECTTFRGYDVETSYEASLMEQSGAISVRGAMVVMQSLTRNGRKVFWILLQFQLENELQPDFKGLRFSQFLAMCQQQFAAHDDARLRAYMTELEDHKLISCRKFEGVEYITVPANASLQASLVEMMTEHFEDDKPE